MSRVSNISIITALFKTFDSTMVLFDHEGLQKKNLFVFNDKTTKLPVSYMVMRMYNPFKKRNEHDSFKKLEDAIEFYEKINIDRGCE